jgi:tetratricopeptide (TPR) repeat protein
MGIFDFLKGDPGNKKEDGLGINVSVVHTPPSKEDLEIRELKRHAAEVKKEDINKAIQLMEQVVGLENGEDKITDSIRLAKYLYKANRGDESWKLYNELIGETARIKDKFSHYLSLMKIYEAMGQQLEQEGKYKTALRSYLMAGFLQKKADLQYLIGMKKENKEMIAMGALSSKEADESVQKEKNNYYERVHFLSSDFHSYIKRDKLPEEKIICGKILDECGGWNNFLDSLDKISLSAFTNKISDIIEKSK